MRGNAPSRPTAPQQVTAGRPGQVPPNQANLEVKELKGTMLAVLRFFADIAPQIVHRDHRGGWTGFPLKSQPAVGDPLHPEEPVGDIAAANAWLNRRRPNGDL